MNTRISLISFYMHCYSEHGPAISMDALNSSHQLGGNRFHSRGQKTDEDVILLEEAVTETQSHNLWKRCYIQSYSHSAIMP